MALEGDLTTFAVRDLLGWLAGRRATGTLSLVRGMVAWQLRLRQGMVTVASSPAGSPRLGRLLVERGLLEEAALAGALERSRRSHARLGRTLERAGLVSAEAVAALLAERIRRVLDEVLAWSDGRFVFDEGEGRERAAVSAAVDLGAHLMEDQRPVVGITEADVVEITDLEAKPVVDPGARRPAA
jgi:hypothetical protein